MKLKYFFFLLLIPFLVISTRFVRAEDECDVTCWDRKIGEYQDKLNQLSDEAQTLSTAIEYFDGQIGLAQAEINKTQAQLNQVEHEIGVLSGKITHLDTSLESLSELLLNRIGTTYRLQRADPIYLIFSSQGLSDYFTRYQHLVAVQSHDKEILVTMEQTKRSYDQQKTTKEEKQAKIEALQNQLKQQRTNLAQQSLEKQTLLVITRNDEKTYQNLLAKAQAEIASLKGFTSTRGDSCLGSPQAQPDGWYWSQRDSRWCNQQIGSSSENIGEVGCLISSIAMVWQKHSQSRTPAQIAGDTAYFFSNTAYMNNPPPVPNYIQRGGYDPSFIDSKLAEGQPVIVHIDLGGDGHFVVLKSGSNGDYIMNDPWYGPDIPLNNYYSVGNIDSIRIFTQ